MTRYSLHALLLLVTTTVVVALFGGCGGGTPRLEEARELERTPRIRPDYESTVIPPNIAPLRFMVEEEGEEFFVRIGSTRGEVIELHSTDRAISIPGRAWKKLLAQNRGDLCYTEVYVKAANGRWDRFQRIMNRIAQEKVDGFLVYRKKTPGLLRAGAKVAIHQRNVENFTETVVLDGRNIGDGCVNCHAFQGKRSDAILLGFRAPFYGSGTVLVKDGEAHRIQAKFGFTSWHPSRRLAVYSRNSMLPLICRVVGRELRDSVDTNSAIMIFNVDERTIRKTPALARKDRLENWPVWSADGRHLYFCSAPRLWSDDSGVLPEGYKDVKYDLVRIGYDPERDEWLETETVLSSKQTGLNMTIPRVSPEGRWLSFCVSEYGYMPTFQESSDIYMIDLERAEKTGRYEYRRVELNSEWSDAWHTWSSNGRWIAFSSKRDSGVFTRIYIAYIDAEGMTYKPFLLPQKDPSPRGTECLIYSVPEFLVEPVIVRGEELGRVIRASMKVPVDEVSQATPKIPDVEILDSSD